MNEPWVQFSEDKSSNAPLQFIPPSSGAGLEQLLFLDWVQEPLLSCWQGLHPDQIEKPPLTRNHYKTKHAILIILKCF